MPLIASRRLQQSAFIAVAALGLMFGVAGAAHAFTLAPAYTVNADSSANLQRPARQFQNSGQNNSIGLPGGATLNFHARNSQGASNNDYNFNAIMDRLSAPGR